MKKLIKVLVILIVIAIVLLGGAAVALKLMFPLAKLKSMAQEYVAQNYNRDIDFSDVSLNLIGVTIESFKLSDEGGFEAGNFISADSAVVKVELMPLFKKQIKIRTIGFDGVELNVIKNTDGKFNFDNLIPASADEVSPQPEEEQLSSTPLAMDLTAKDIYIRNSDITYKDLQSGMDFAVEDVNFEIKDFDYNNPFSFELSFNTSIDTGDIKISPVKILAKGVVNIAGLELEKASAEITDFAVEYKGFKVNMTGGISNLQIPDLSLKGEISGIDDKLASEFVSGDIPAFALPVINLEAKASADLENSKAEVSKFDVSLGKSYIKNTAAVDFSKPEISYAESTSLNVNLSEVSDISKELLAAFKLKGSITGDIKAVSAGSDKPLVTGSVVLKDIGAAAMGKILSALNGEIKINSLDDIKTNTIKGVFDGSDFKTSLAYKNNRKMSVDFMFNMDKFTLEDIDFDELLASAKSGSEDVEASPESATSGGASNLQMAPMDVKADIIIKRVENNVFSTDDLTFKADVKDLDLTMKKASGTVYFSSSAGEIRDLDKLINSSVFLKVALTTVKIAQKALKATQIISGAEINTDSVSYKSIIGDYRLGGGKATINKSDLNSDLATVNTSGSINFVTQQLDMTVKVGLGKNASGSANIKVGGSIEDPSFKLDVASTVSSLLNSDQKETAKQAVDNVKNTVKDVTSGIKNLFKKK